MTNLDYATPSLTQSEHKLITGGGSDPLLPQLIQAINHATQIDIAVSFIQPSGLELLFTPLLDALERDVTINILTSDYLAITSPFALRRLMQLQERGAQCRVFECQDSNSFHMKSYIFVRMHHGEMAEGCAFIGSNNISRTALLDGHEWTLRHDYMPPANSPAAQDFAHIQVQFLAIFQHPYTQPLSRTWIDDYQIRHEQTKIHSRLIKVIWEDDGGTTDTPTPNSIQELALAALANTRKAGFKRGLVVLATGMGKTWLAAFDARQMHAKRVLFVAHREEILLQAEETFLRLNPHAHTGLYNGNQKNGDADYLFASVSTLGQDAQLQRFAPDHFDYIVVDEFHHASAQTYQALLAYFTPTFLLGLTATPERTDRADILSLCDNNLVYSRDLQFGINAGILVPFTYYGIRDESVDYQEIPWRNGKFDPVKLENQFATERRAKHIFNHWHAKKQQRTLAFCVSKSHANYMDAYFKRHGIRSCAVYSDSTVRRNEALRQLNSGELDIIFSVDLFNEGTDLPAIDTVVMIRPTESKILFLQQLGRGLRLSPASNKTQLVVIDFVGNHTAFLNRPAALLGTRNFQQLKKALREPTLALGCFVNFDPVVIKLWLALIEAKGFTASEHYAELTEQLGHRPTATEFYQSEYPFSKVRQQYRSWFDLVAQQESSDDELHQILAKHHDFLLKGIEMTAMSKCFKAVLLQALLELDGFNTPPTLSALAIRSHRVLSRHPDLKATELPEKMRSVEAKDSAWLTYWKGNPIKAFTHANASGEQWFTVQNDRFVPTFSVEPQHIERFHQLVQELVDLRLAQYVERRVEA